MEQTGEVRRGEENRERRGGEERREEQRKERWRGETREEREERWSVAVWHDEVEGVRGRSGRRARSQQCQVKPRRPAGRLAICHH